MRKLRFHSKINYFNSVLVSICERSLRNKHIDVSQLCMYEFKLHVNKAWLSSNFVVLILFK